MKMGRHSTITFNDYTNDWNVEVEVGHFTNIARGLVILGGQHPPKYCPEAVSSFNFWEAGWPGYHPCINGEKITIGNDVWIGTNAILLNGAKVGDGCIVGAGCVLAKEVPPYSVVVGNPAKVIKYRFAPDAIEKLLRIAWWNWDDEKVKANLCYLKDINVFLERFWQDGTTITHGCGRGSTPIPTG